MKIKKVLAGLDKEDLKQIKETGTFIIPEDITEIGDSAFFALRSLKRIVIPESVERIGEMAFAGCSTIEEITFKGKPTIAEYAFEDCDVNLIITSANLTKKERVAILSEFTKAEGEYEFSYPEGSGFITLIRTGVYTTSDKVDTIDDSGFQGLKIIQKLIVSKNIKTIGEFAFSDCPNLREVVFEGAPRIGKFAFNSPIEKITILGGINPIDRDRLVKQLQEEFYYSNRKVEFVFEEPDGKADENDDENDIIAE